MAKFEANCGPERPFPFKKKANYRVVPWTTFTDPELARVGLSEDEAKKAGTKISWPAGRERCWINWRGYLINNYKVATPDYIGVDCGS